MVYAILIPRGRRWRTGEHPARATARIHHRHDAEALIADRQDPQSSRSLTIETPLAAASIWHSQTVPDVHFSALAIEESVQRYLDLQTRPVLPGSM